MAIEKTVLIKVETDSAVKNVNNLDKSVEQLDDSVKQVGDDVQKTGKDIDAGFKKGSKGVKGFRTAIKGVGLAIKAAGIGILITVISSITAALGENQKVMDFFSTALKTVGIAVNDLFTFVGDNVGTVVDYFKAIFENPVESLKAFGNAIKENLIERFESFLDTLGFIAEGVKNLFSGEFDAALESFKSAGKEAVDVLTGVDGSVDKITESVTTAVEAISEYTAATIEMANESVKAEKSLERLRLEQDRLNESYDREAELQRQIRDDTTKSIEERIEANRRLGEILTEQAKVQDTNIKSRIDILKEEQEQLGYNEEIANQIYELETERIALDARITGIRSEQLTNENQLLDEQRQSKEEQADNEKKLIKETSEADAKAKQDALDRERQIADAKNALVSETIGKLSQALGEESKAGKAVAVAEATWNTYAGITRALRLPAPFNFIQAAAIGTMGFNSVRSILSTDVGDSPNLSGASQSGASVTPQYNVVGVSDSNQLTESISQSNSNVEPVRAYVVSTEMSSQQELDRNIETSASF